MQEYNVTDQIPRVELWQRIKIVFGVRGKVFEARGLWIECEDQKIV